MKKSEFLYIAVILPWHMGELYDWWFKGGMGKILYFVDVRCIDQSVWNFIWGISMGAQWIWNQLLELVNFGQRNWKVFEYTHICFKRSVSVLEYDLDVSEWI